jgi:hypothetical protein
VGGHTYRVRSPDAARDRILPQIREVFFDDDTMTDARPWVEDVARRLGPLLVPKGMTWSTNAKVNVPFETLRVLKENGLRLFTVGFDGWVRSCLRYAGPGSASWCSGCC